MAGSLAQQRFLARGRSSVSIFPALSHLLKRALLKDGAVEPRLAQELQELRQLSVDAADEVRRAIFSVTGPELQGSLTDSIRSLLQELERSSDIRVHLSVAGAPTLAEETVHDVVNLVVNEALTNVNRHANATVVLVNLRYEPDRIDVVIQDDGVGARVSSSTPSRKTLPPLRAPPHP